MKTALITGITGQDGSYLAELLLSKGYEVYGLVRRSSSINTSRISHILGKINVIYGDLSDSDQIIPLMIKVKPDEVYNLGAQSHAGLSFDMPEYTGNITGLGTTRLLEAIRKNSPDTRFYQASTSEMFGAAKPPQTERTPFNPASPYACAKVYAYWMVRNYRDGYKMFASNGILFNHESPRRGEIFVTRKITIAIANILAGNQKYLELGNLGAKIDWGFAPEYVEAMWRILQQDVPGDYTIGTGETHLVKDFVDIAFDYAGLDKNVFLKSAPALFRPLDDKVLKAGIGHARRTLGWVPAIRLSELVKIMIDADMRKVGLEPIGEGDRIIKAMFNPKWWIND
jgi:GDPmannose 4,6-dehydratase